MENLSSYLNEKETLNGMREKDGIKKENIIINTRTEKSISLTLKSVENLKARKPKGCPIVWRYKNMTDNTLEQVALYTNKRNERVSILYNYWEYAYLFFNETKMEIIKHDQRDDLKIAILTDLDINKPYYFANYLKHNFYNEKELYDGCLENFDYEDFLENILTL